MLSFKAGKARLFGVVNLSEAELEAFCRCTVSIRVIVVRGGMGELAADGIAMESRDLPFDPCYYLILDFPLQRKPDWGNGNR